MSVLYVYEPELEQEKKITGWTGDPWKLEGLGTAVAWQEDPNRAEADLANWGRTPETLQAKGISICTGLIGESG